jgi:hypothetical protein
VDQSQSISQLIGDTGIGEGLANQCLKSHSAEVDHNRHPILQGAPYQATQPWILVSHRSSKVLFLRSSTDGSVAMTRMVMKIWYWGHRTPGSLLGRQRPELNRELGLEITEIFYKT